jgi:dTDP-4-dehydrorhamnose 3,5-epimerase-like enzyme
VLEPAIHGDSRGWFQETYRRNVLTDLGITDDFVQDNHSRSERGVLRGLHFQVGDQPQAKLVRCAIPRTHCNPHGTRARLQPRWRTAAHSACL